MGILLCVIFGYVVMQGKVVRVADGDTITVLSREGSFQKIRLYGIDCPESAQKGGKAATDFTREAVLYQQVRLSILDKDMYGRLVALVHLPDGRTLNEDLVRAGHAWVYRSYCRQPFCHSWMALEQEAKSAKRGLWADADPQPPHGLAGRSHTGEDDPVGRGYNGQVRRDAVPYAQRGKRPADAGLVSGPVIKNRKHIYLKAISL